MNQLARITNSQTADSALRALGCTPSPSHDRLWIVPAGKVRAAKKQAAHEVAEAAAIIARMRAGSIDFDFETTRER